MKAVNSFPALLQAFFTDRLIRQLKASPHTILSYRDTFRLLLGFARKALRKAPSALTLEDLDAPFVGAFLDWLEKERGNSARTRNARLAAIRSFFRYAALQEPAGSAVADRVLAMPAKRFVRRPIEFLARSEVDALLAAPDPSEWSGRRDRALLLLAVQTGLRVSELIGLRCQDAVLGRGAHVRCRGKGRKERCTPLSREAASVLRAWLRERGGAGGEPLFPNARGSPLSRDGVEYLLAKHVRAAIAKCPSLGNKRVTPHSLRHTAAMDLLQHGVDRTVIALWLGHESAQTTEVYLHADLKLKQRALAKTASLEVKPHRYRPDDQLLAFLKSL